MHRNKIAWALVLFLCVAAHSAEPQHPGQPDDPAAELVRARAEIQKAFEVINSTNPMSDQYGKPAPGVPGMPATAAQRLEMSQKHGELLRRAEDLQRLLSHPAVQGYLKLFNNPVFSAAAERVVKHPDKTTLLYGEIGLFVLLIVFRSWRTARARHWAHRLWIKTYSLVLWAALAAVALPALIIGRDYYNILRGLF